LLIRIGFLNYARNDVTQVMQRNKPAAGKTQDKTCTWARWIVK